ncbi:alpha/beta fold hydrolase [Bacillus sp. SJS]|uniref:alpha/beta fold hydrolase n=1 Tax=Bacillus sp. SJS TaxID=1423321 RepID=UPI0004DCB67F|nr:alpha/beta fold hydrolase [Bacillus sp. SJS]KZZ83338.1 hypothetical protein AS29_016435 [Bacillus sp. SJS]
MKKWLKIFIAILTSAVVLLAGGFFVWSQFTYKPSKDLTRLVPEDSYTETDGILYFDPSGTKTEAGVILYPGAKVEPEAYAFIGQELAKTGIPVAIPEMPFHCAILGTGKAERVQSSRPKIKKWYIGGHSLGGVAAANYAAKHEKSVEGVFFLASYPAESAKLKQTNVDVLSIFAANDGLTSLDDIENSKKNVPDDALFYEIKGGNHAQFGLYGKQKGDHSAEIPAEEQQKQIIQYIENWIKRGSGK